MKGKAIIEERAKERQIRKPNSVPQKSAKQNPIEKPIDTREELAKKTGVSHDTIHKVEKVLASDNEALKQQMWAGDLSINRGCADGRRQRIAFYTKSHSRGAFLRAISL